MSARQGAICEVPIGIGGLEISMGDSLACHMHTELHLLSHCRPLCY